MGEVDANLVCATGLELHAHVRVRPEAPDDPVVGDCLASALAHRHAHAIGRMPVDGCIHRAARGHHATADRLVLAAHLALAEHAYQRRVRRQGSRDDQ